MPTVPPPWVAPADTPTNVEDSDLQAILDSLEELRQTVEDARMIPNRIDALRLNRWVEPSKWPKPGPPRPGLGAVKRLPGDPSFEEAWTDFQARGEAALSGRPARRALEAGLRAADDKPWLREAPTLSALIEGLLGALRLDAQAKLLEALYLAAYPPWDAIAGRALPRGARTPMAWAAISPGPGPLPGPVDGARALQRAALDGVFDDGAHTSLPDIAPDWRDAALLRARPANLAQAERLIAFADAWQSRDGAALTPATAAALRAREDAGRRCGEAPRQTAQRLVQRVGSPFGADATARWAMVPELLGRVRAALAGEVLRVVFEHLRPPGKSADQLDARLAFWQGYSGSVQRITIAVSGPIKRQLEHEDIRKIREIMGKELQVRTLKGGQLQAIVWMHLNGQAGPLTVVEGNANTTLRMCRGEVRAPNGEVDYSADIVHGELTSDRLQAIEIVHTRDRWQAPAEQWLRRSGARPPDPPPPPPRPQPTWRAP